MVSTHPVFAEASTSTPSLKIIVDPVAVSRCGISLRNLSSFKLLLRRLILLILSGYASVQLTFDDVVASTD